MNGLMSVVWWVAAVGSTTSSIYCLMVLAAALKFGLRKRREIAQPPDFLPPISVFKPLHGTEPGMEQNLISFFEQQYPGEWELLFCARHATDEGLQLAEEVGKRYPQVAAQYITCGEPLPEFHNAKVYSFDKLDTVARYDQYITSDGDVRVAPDYLLRLAQNFKDPKLGIVSCLYIGTPYSGAAANFSSKLDSVGKSVEMTSGVLVADMLAGTTFALGATQVLPRKSFQAVGGFRELGQFYADDYELGNRLSKQGAHVSMATHVIKLMVQDVPFWLSFRNQLRWMQSTRRSRPWGHFGSGLTFATPFGVLGLAWGLATAHPLAGLLWLLAMFANRWVQAAAILGVLGDPDWLENVAIYPLRDLLGSVLWASSYLGERFYYRGGIYRLKPGGRVEATE
jgi:ceramide glucosyltransferase